MIIGALIYRFIIQHPAVQAAAQNAYNQVTGATNNTTTKTT
jgi:hypothetical protein